MSSELYACLFVREFPAQAMLRMRSHLRGHALAVMDGKPPMQQVCSLNSLAKRAGAEHAMTLVEIDTLPQVATLSRSFTEEESARAALLSTVATFSPRIETCCEETMFVCVADIAGTEKLFGPPAILGQKLLTQIGHMGVEASVVICVNFHTAVCLASAASAQSQVQIVSEGEESSALAGLPLHVLTLSPQLEETFSLWGIRTLGELAQLPEEELIARIGQQGSVLHQLACGTRAHLFVPLEPVATLREEMELDSLVELLEPLLFLMNMMLEQLILRSGFRAEALASVTVTLSLDGNLQHTRTVRPALPSNDRALWLQLLHLDLQAHPPSASVSNVQMVAEPGRTAKMQGGLFAPQLPGSMRLDVTLARIRALVGEGHVGRAVLRDTHKADAFQVEPFRLPPAAGSNHAVKISQRTLLSQGHWFRRDVKSANQPGVLTHEARQARCVLRRLRPPEFSAVIHKNGVPSEFCFREKYYQVEHAYGPWQMAGEWWNPQLWSVEQWDLIACEAGGASLCCCLSRDTLQDAWHVVALYD